ncbi:MAG TPA: YbdD/YjiX family protein [Gemmatimonadales bacterium]
MPGKAARLTASLAGAWHALVARLPVPPARLLRQVAGMPDYAAFVEHLRRCHPERTVPSERDYFDAFLRARYGDGPSRCC